MLLSAIGGWGAWRIAEGSLTREGTPLRVGLIQGNIAQEDKWKPGEARRIFTTYLAMTRDAVRRGAQFVIWPESSTPFMFEEDDVGEAAAARRWRARCGVPILFGSDQVDRSGATLARMYNAAFLVAPDGETAAVYRKIHLVPFGEFIPMQAVAVLSSRRWWRAWRSSRPATSMVMLPVGGHLISTAICYEVVYPSLIRAGGRRRQRAADDHHQRRVVRPLVGAVPALRAGVDARDRAGALPGARRQHRHQRRRRPLRARRRSSRLSSSRSGWSRKCGS